MLEVTYDRDVLATILVYHWRTETSGCGCGWAELGRSHPEHVANVYEESMRAKEVTASSGDDELPPKGTMPETDDAAFELLQIAQRAVYDDDAKLPPVVFAAGVQPLLEAVDLILFRVQQLERRSVGE